jgi:hypothetical protein
MNCVAKGLEARAPFTAERRVGKHLDMFTINPQFSNKRAPRLIQILSQIATNPRRFSSQKSQKWQLIEVPKLKNL